MTPPPFPPEQAKNSGGKSSNLPSQSIMTTSSSVHAGLAICIITNTYTKITRSSINITQEKPIQAIESLNISARIAGHELAVGK